MHIHLRSVSEYNRCDRMLRRRQSASALTRPSWLWIPLVLFTAFACSSPTAPTTTVAGTWAEVFGFPGASLILTIDANGNGNGTYAIEAGRAGTVSVSGSVTPSAVSLVVRYDSGTTQTFVGAPSDTTHLTGTFTGNAGTVTFVRR